jgi:hypothetical protein
MKTTAKYDDYSLEKTGLPERDYILSNDAVRIEVRTTK